MKINNIVLLAIVLVTAACTNEIKPTAASNVKSNRLVLLSQETAGKALFQSYVSGKKELSNKVKYKVPYCNSRYSVVHSSGSQYLISESNNPDTIVIGRHFKLSKGSIVKSSNSCLAIPKQIPQGATAVASYATHILTSYPTEFHVFLSLKHSIPLFIGTDIGMWKVEKGKISFVSKPA